MQGALRDEGDSFGAEMSTIASGALLFGVHGLCKQAAEEEYISPRNEIDPRPISHLENSLPVISYVRLVLIGLARNR